MKQLLLRTRLEAALPRRRHRSGSLSRASPKLLRLRSVRVEYQELPPDLEISSDIVESVISKPTACRRAAPPRRRRASRRRPRYERRRSPATAPSPSNTTTHAISRAASSSSAPFPPRSASSSNATATRSVPVDPLLRQPGPRPPDPRCHRRTLRHSPSSALPPASPRRLCPDRSPQAQTRARRQSLSFAGVCQRSSRALSGAATRYSQSDIGTK